MAWSPGGCLLARRTHPAQSPGGRETQAALRHRGCGLIRHSGRHALPSTRGHDASQSEDSRPCGGLVPCNSTRPPLRAQRTTGTCPVPHREPSRTQRGVLKGPGRTGEGHAHSELAVSQNAFLLARDDIVTGGTSRPVLWAEACKRRYRGHCGHAGLTHRITEPSHAPPPAPCSVPSPPGVHVTPGGESYSATLTKPACGKPAGGRRPAREAQPGHRIPPGARRPRSRALA